MPGISDMSSGQCDEAAGVGTQHGGSIDGHACVFRADGESQSRVERDQREISVCGYMISE